MNNDIERRLTHYFSQNRKNWEITYSLDDEEDEVDHYQVRVSNTNPAIEVEETLIKNVRGKKTVDLDELKQPKEIAIWQKIQAFHETKGLTHHDTHVIVPLAYGDYVNVSETRASLRHVFRQIFFPHLGLIAIPDLMDYTYEELNISPKQKKKMALRFAQDIGLALDTLAEIGLTYHGLNDDHGFAMMNPDNYDFFIKGAIGLAEGERELAEIIYYFSQLFTLLLELDNLELIQIDSNSLESKFRLEKDDPESEPFLKFLEMQMMSDGYKSPEALIADDRTLRQRLDLTFLGLIDDRMKEYVFGRYIDAVHSTYGEALFKYISDSLKEVLTNPLDWSYQTFAKGLASHLKS